MHEPAGRLRGLHRTQLAQLTRWRVAVRPGVLFSGAVAIVAVHAAVDSFLAPEPGTGPADPWGALIRFGLQIGTLCATDTSFGASQGRILRELDLDALRRFDRPVYFALGGRSHPDYYAERQSGSQTSSRTSPS